MARTTKISVSFNEQLLSLWLNGKSLSEIVRIYKDTPMRFCFRTLLRVKDTYHWEERKETMTMNIQKEAEFLRCMVHKKKIQSSSLMNEMFLNKVMEEYRSFSINSEEYFRKIEVGERKRPFWLAKSLKEFHRLVKISTLLHSDQLE